MSVADWLVEAEDDGPTMTVEEFLALPDDGVHRELIRGRVRVWGDQSVTVRNRFHATVESRIAHFLWAWIENRPKPSGQVVSGEAAFRLGGTRESAVGIDVAYVSAEMVAATPADQSIFRGPPVLAVEILSPSDRHGDILEKIELYLDAGVAVVWEVEPRLRTVRVHRPGREPMMFSASQDLACEDELPGFRVPTASLFGDRP